MWISCANQEVEPIYDFEVSTYLPPLRSSPAISASQHVLFVASSFNYVYAYDIEDTRNPNGTILRFPYEMCDIRDLLVIEFGDTMASTNFSGRCHVDACLRALARKTYISSASLG